MDILRTKFDHRAANVPHFSGAGGITPTSCFSTPLVGNSCGTPGSFVPVFRPDVREFETALTYRFSSSSES
jgi:hypothetical protein